MLKPLEKTYRIQESSLNIYQADISSPQYLVVSVLAGAKVQIDSGLHTSNSFFKNGVVGYNAALEAKKWAFTGCNLALNDKYRDSSDSGLFVPLNIYLRLEASAPESNGRVIITPNDYDIDGYYIEPMPEDSEGTASGVTSSDEAVIDRPDYRYKKIADDDGNMVKVQKDSGYFYLCIGNIYYENGERVFAINYGTYNTQKQRDEEKSNLNGMFEWSKDSKNNVVIKALKPFLEIDVRGNVSVGGVAINKFIADEQMAKFITAWKSGDDDFFKSWNLDTTISTTAAMASYVAYYVKKQIDALDARFLRKDQPDTAAGRITFSDGISLGESGGEITSEGEASLKQATLRGTLSVGGDASVTGEATFAEATTIGSAGISTSKPAQMRAVTFGDYTPGIITGAEKGARIEEGGHADFKSLSVGEFLEVPELRFNRAAVTTGVGIRSMGGGIVEEVIPDLAKDGSEMMSGRLALKLEDGEYGAVAEGDKCLGFWHNLTGNSSQSKDDHTGDFELRGFSTIYFRIDHIYPTEAAFRKGDATAEGTGSCKYVHYALRGDEGVNGWKQKHHPKAGMHFGQIANDRDTERQSIRISTTTYELQLKDMTDWNYTSVNIVKVDGVLDGFSMESQRWDEGKGEYVPVKKTFEGTGTVLGNAYIYGQIDQFEKVGYRATVTQSLGGSMMPGETEEETVQVWNGYGEDVTHLFTVYSVTRDSGDASSDAVWNEEHVRVTNPFHIKFSDLNIDGIHQLSALFRVTASMADGTQKASALLEYMT